MKKAKVKKMSTNDFTKKQIRREFFTKYLYNKESKNKINVDFLYNNINNIYWGNSEIYKNFDENIVNLCYYKYRELYDKFSWPNVTSCLIRNLDNSKNEKISEKFIEIHKEKIDWSYMNNIIHLYDIDFYEKYKRKIYWQRLHNNTNIKLEIAEEFSDKLDFNSFTRFNSNLTIEFIEKNIDKINFRELSYNKRLSLDIIRKYKDKLDFYNISEYNENINNEEFLNEFDSKLQYKNLLVKRFGELPLSFYEKNLDKLELENIFSVLVNTTFNSNENFEKVLKILNAEIRKTQKKRKKTNG